MEPLAATVHGRFCQALRDLSSFTVHADVLVDAVHEDGSVVQRARRVDLAARRPAAFRAITEGDDLALESYFDGKALTLRFPRENTTATLPAAMDLDNLLDVLARDHGLEAPLGDLLRQDACAGMRPLAAYHVGMSRVEGVACHHLYYQGEDVDWQIWVEDSAASLPRKLLIVEKDLPGKPRYMAVFSRWKRTRLADGLFSPPPAGGWREEPSIFARKAAP